MTTYNENLEPVAVASGEVTVAWFLSAGLVSLAILVVSLAG